MVQIKVLPKHAMRIANKEQSVILAGSLTLDKFPLRLE